MEINPEDIFHQGLLRHSGNKKQVCRSLPVWVLALSTYLRVTKPGAPCLLMDHTFRNSEGR